MPNSSRILFGVLFAASLAIAVPANAATISVTLHWTAPGDDSLTGRATRYELRYSQLPITSVNFSLATLVSGVPAPKPEGSSEQFVVNGLLSTLTYYFAIKSFDDANNASGLSNLAYKSGTVGVGDSGTPLWFSPPWPNPAREVARWSFSLPRDAMVDVDVFDVAGHLVRTLARGARYAGAGELTWDLRGRDGSLVGAGQYFVRASLDGQMWVRRLTVVR